MLPSVSIQLAAKFPRKIKKLIVKSIGAFFKSRTSANKMIDALHKLGHY